MTFTALVFPLEASAVDLSGTSLNTHQKYFFRVLGSLSRADYYEKDILASVTLAQSIYEGGWGRYSLPIGGNNLFGIKAYSTWSGKVYDQKSHTLYNSYSDLLIDMGQSYINSVSAWRAHDSWAESVGVHSSLFINESKYAAVVGEKDYKVMAHAIVDAGYCNDDGYADTVIALIEQYGMTEYDDLTPDEDGVVAITSPEERVYLEIGDTYTVALAVYPSDKTPSSVTWKSDDESVATVDENGVVTAKAHGMTLVSATLANGREACCIVYVDCNATVIDKDVNVYASPTSTSANGKIYRGYALKVTSDNVYTDASGNKMLAVMGYNNKGALVSGYVLAENVYRQDRNVSKISFVKNDLTLKVNDKYTVRTVVAPADANDTSLTWVSSDSSVASVENGVITAKKLGNAIINVSAVGGKSVNISVTVASSYREYPAVVSAYEEVNVRAEANASSTRVGKIPFLSSVTVIGEPVDNWVKIKGATANGTVITGYADSAYIRIIKDGNTLEYGTAPENTTVYASASTASVKYGTLETESEYAVLEKLSNNWYYIVGRKSSGSGVYGYAQITSSGSTVVPPVTGTSDAWYGRTTSNLYVRKGAGSSYDSVGQFANGTDVIISGEENGWYKVTGTSNTGVQISGYSSSQYIITLYSGVTTSRLNLRDSDSTSGNVVKVIESGVELVIVGEKLESGWYAVEVNGVSGYCSGDYVTVNGKLPAESSNVPDVPVVPEEKFEIINSEYTVSDMILSGVAPDTTAVSFLSGFKGEVSVVDVDGNALSDSARIGTGCVLRAKVDGVVTDIAAIVVKGDTNGDGTVNIFDALAVKRAFLGSGDLSGYYLQAASVSGKEKLTVFDYVMIKRAALGYYEF